MKYSIFAWKIEIFSIQSFKECLFFVFCLFCCFLLLSNNTLHLMFYCYICYWSTFQYKHIIQITVVKQSDARVTSKDICLFFIVLFLCPFSSCLDFVFFNETLLLLCCLTHFTSLVFFYTPWKHQNSGGFLMFSGAYRKRPEA